MMNSNLLKYYSTMGFISLIVIFLLQPFIPPGSLFYLNLYTIAWILLWQVSVHYWMDFDRYKTHYRWGAFYTGIVSLLHPTGWVLIAYILIEIAIDTYKNRHIL